jgi:hypothetical protein
MNFVKLGLAGALAMSVSFSAAAAETEVKGPSRRDIRPFVEAVGPQYGKMLDKVDATTRGGNNVHMKIHSPLTIGRVTMNAASFRLPGTTTTEAGKVVEKSVGANGERIVDVKVDRRAKEGGGWKSKAFSWARRWGGKRPDVVTTHSVIQPKPQTPPRLPPARSGKP